jgi:hypothetical protein
VSAEFRYPGRPFPVLVETVGMRTAFDRTLSVHGGGQFAVWTGASRLGKTTTASWGRNRINAAAARPDGDPDAFRAAYLEVGKVGPWGGHAQKQVLRSLFHGLIGKLPEAVYRQSPVEDLAAMIVGGLARDDTQLVWLDEAGRLSVEALDGLCLVVDAAAGADPPHPLTIVLVGMNDLPTKVHTREQLRNRIHEWVHFAPYTHDETWALLAALHPHFALLNPRRRAHQEQVAFVHDLALGRPGLVVPFVRRVVHWARDHGGAIDLTLLRAVHLMMQRDLDRSARDQEAGYPGLGAADDPPEDDDRDDAGTTGDDLDRPTDEGSGAGGPAGAA